MCKEIKVWYFGIQLLLGEFYPLQSKIFKILSYFIFVHLVYNKQSLHTKVVLVYKFDIPASN